MSGALWTGDHDGSMTQPSRLQIFFIVALSLHCKLSNVKPALIYSTPTYTSRALQSKLQERNMKQATIQNNSIQKGILKNK